MKPKTACRPFLRFAALLVPLFWLFPFTASANAVDDRRTKLESDLAALEKQIEVQRGILSERQRQSVSLERDIAILDATIEKAKLSIRARTLVISELSSDIAQKKHTIGALADRIGREKDSLGEIVRKTYRADSFSLPEIVLSGERFSDFFADVDSYRAVKGALRRSYLNLEDVKGQTEEARAALEDKRAEQTDLKRLQELEKRKIEREQAQKNKILTISRGLEVEYQKIIKAQELSAAQIRAELFTLRGSAAIPFGKAYDYALVAAKKTGVRPAVILGVIAEESNLGENVGTGNWRVDMKTPRDTEPFLDITRRLGLDPDSMPVSKKAWYGFGGAMGPAQFLPSTWVLYEERIAGATGHNPPNPWEPADAFMAAALLMSDNGARARTPEAERLAALRYLAGWSNARKPAYSFYGDDVMDLADKYQRQIDILQNS